MRVSSSLTARIGAAVAAAAIAATGATAAANAATAAPAKVTTALSISNSTPKAHLHRTSAVVKGQLTAVSTHISPVRGVWVLLQRQGPKGHWFAVQAERTGRHGWVAFVVHVRNHAVHFRLLFRGNRNFARSVSAVDTISPVTAS
jgi:hypothetical protein